MAANTRSVYQFGPVNCANDGNIVCTETPSQFPDDFKITPLAATAAGDTLTVTPVPVSFNPVASTREPSPVCSAFPTMITTWA